MLSLPCPSRSFHTNAAYTALGKTSKAPTTPTRIRRTGIDLAANGRTFAVERWVAVATDSITVDYAAIITSRLGFAV